MFKYIHVFMVSLLLSSFGCSQAPVRYDVEKPFPYLSLKVSSDLPKDPKYNLSNGLEILVVGAGSPAEEAGLRPGDILIGLQASEFKKSKAKVLEEFSSRFERLDLGSEVSLTFLRPLERNLNCACSVKPNFELLEAQMKVRPRKFSGGPRVIPPDSELHPELSEADDHVASSITQKLVKHYKIEKNYLDLRQRLTAMTQTADSFRRFEVSYAQRNPFRMPSIAQGIFARIKPDGNLLSTGDKALKESFLLLDLKSNTQSLTPLPPLKIGLTPSEHIRQLKQVLSQVNADWNEAFANLSSEEVGFLRTYGEDLATAFDANIYIHLDDNSPRYQRNLRVLSLAAKVNFAPLIHGTRSLLRIADLQYIKGLKTDLKQSGKDLSVPEVISEATRFGRIVIGGTGNNVYDDLDEKEVAVLIDLGGNDFYANKVGAPTKNIHASIAVDLEGDDAYESNTNFAQGSGFLGIGILVDHSGDDKYIAYHGAQGASFLGVGLLMDDSGNDTYRAQTQSQGCGFFGFGALIDLSGNDRYDTQLLSQGVGIAGGIGMLIDQRGNDSYYAKGAQSSGYGEPGLYEGWSQGVGVGLRGLASGGIGILSDGDGEDLLEAGNFSQGGGYYFGWGMVKADGTKDRHFIGSRYAQGFSAHYAVGTFFGGGGNDHYESRSSVAAGLAWDLGISWFEDQGGRNTYPLKSAGKNFSLGASAQNAIAVFIDHGGRGRYEGTALPATARDNNYHGGSSLSLFFSLAASDDLSKLFKGDTLLATKEYGFAFNLKNGFKEVLKDDFLKSHGRPFK